MTKTWETKTWEELAELVIVTALPYSDVENAITGKRTGKATKLQAKIVEALKEAYERGRHEAKL